MKTRPGKKAPLLLRFLPALLVAFCLNPALAQMPPRNSSAMTESDRDIYGMWQRSPNYSRVQNLGIRVVDMPAFNSFFAYYLPASFERQSVKRAIVAVHGTGGTAYAEIQDESAMAQKLGYAVIAIQMRLPKDEKRNLPPREMYGLIDQAIRFLKRERKLDISRLAYVGFSVGGAKSFQIAYQDSQSPRPLFSLIVNHSGLSKAETAFLSDIEAGRGPAQPFKGLPFALYCGLRDESWKSQQCDDMARWEQLLVRLGANPIRAIRDEAGGHMGYRKNPDHHEAVMRWFYELTP